MPDIETNDGPLGAVWDCQIGGIDRATLPRGADAPMRKAVEQAFRNLTGKDAEFCFSGWGGKLTRLQLNVVRPDEFPLSDRGKESSADMLARIGTDAQLWARAFLAMDFDPDSIDEGLLIGWFANAIEAGRIAQAASHPTPEPLDAQLVLALLYEHEINCGVSSFWDEGYRAWIGDDLNGRTAEQDFHPNPKYGRPIDQIGNWLWEAAVSRYPELEKPRDVPTIAAE